MRKTLIYHENTLMIEVHIEAGGCVTMHNHPQVQTGYCIKGAIDLEVNGEKAVCRPGSAWVIPGGADHETTATEPYIIVEIFSPVREDYKP